MHALSASYGMPAFEFRLSASALTVELLLVPARLLPNGMAFVLPLMNVVPLIRGVIILDASEKRTVIFQQHIKQLGCSLTAIAHIALVHCRTIQAYQAASSPAAYLGTSRLLALMVSQSQPKQYPLQRPQTQLQPHGTPQGALPVLWWGLW